MAIHMFQQLIDTLKKSPKKIVFTEGTDARILEASARLLSGTFLTPVLVGNADEIQAAAGRVDGIVLNPGGYAHTSVAILDALRLCGVPAVEVLLTAPDEREPFRKTDVVSFGCQGHFIGEGPQGYLHACIYLAQLLRTDGSSKAHIVM